MGYWTNVRIAGEMGDHLHTVLALLFLGALLLGWFIQDVRPRLRLSILLLALTEAGTLVSGWILYGGFAQTGELYRTVHLATAWCLTVAAITLGSVLIFRVVLPAVRLRPPPILVDTIIGIVYFAVALALLSHHGVNLSGIIATSAVLTAVVGLSLQDTLGNVMNGMAMQLERSVAVGDWVRIGDVEGIVREIRWRQTTIESRNWDTIVIPNSLVMKAQLTVLGKKAGTAKVRRVTVTFNVDFRHSPAEIIEAVETALRLDIAPGVAGDPPPQCILKEYRDSYAVYAVRYWMSDFSQEDSISSEVLGRLYVALHRAGIRLSIPASTQFLKLENRRRREEKREEEIRNKAAALQTVSILEPLTAEERAELASRLTVAPFRRGEILTRQGNQGHFLYVIAQGETQVTVEGNGRSEHVATLKAGDVVGEMALVTGEPRSATVAAKTDVLCYRLDKESFKDVLERRPEIAQAISHLLASRRLELDKVAKGFSADAASQELNKVEGELLAKIRHFFMLS